MTYIPDVRTDENYNEKFLNEEDKMFLAGYDWAVEQATNMCNNLEVYPELLEIMEDNKAVIKEGKADILKDALSHWLEADRNELVVSMLDAYEDEE